MAAPAGVASTVGSTPPPVLAEETIEDVTAGDVFRTSPSPSRGTDSATPPVTGSPAGPTPGTAARSVGGPTQAPGSPPTAPPSSEGTFYLASKANGDTNAVTLLPLRTSAPTNGNLPNYDRNRDDDAGLTVQRTKKGLEETDSKQQIWVVQLSSALRAEGAVRLTFWSMLADGATGPGRVEAVWGVCEGSWSDGCELISAGIQESGSWSGGSWTERTLVFDDATRTIPAGRWIGFKLVVSDVSAGDMWLAYDTRSYPSRLSFD